MERNSLNSSFTLIELLITVTIIFIFSGLSIASYNNFTQNQQLKNEAKKFIDVLELAKKKALAGDLSNISNTSCSNFNGYQINISNNNYNLNLCCSSNCSTLILINEYSLTNDFQFTTTPTFQFLPLSAGVVSANPFSFPLNICLKNTKINKFNKIVIEKSGIIKLEEDLTTSCP